MKNKICASIIIFCLLAVSMALLIACDSPSLDSQSGKDSYGRDYGKIYNIDEYFTGVYAIEYSIGDTSSMGQSMIGSNCYEKVKLAVSDNQYLLTFYCKNDAFTKVRLNGELGEEVEESDMYGYKFSISRDALNAKLSMSGRVSLMNKDVSFSIKIDLTKATLIGNADLKIQEDANANKGN